MYIKFLTAIAFSIAVIRSSIAQTAPVLENSKYHFAFKDFYFELDPNSGGRISSFKFRNKEVLYTDSSGRNNNWGSTFWPAPQSLWGWPPSDTLDKLPYKAVVKNNELTLISSPNKKGVTVTFEKSFRVDEANNSIIATYKIINNGSVVDTIGPWQITRVPSGGLTFFPMGTTPARGQLLPLLKQKDNISWFDYDSSFVARDPEAVPKLFSDASEGWLAHTNKEGLLLIFKFKDTTPAQKSPGEDEVEIYTNPNLSYTELEPLGPYKVLQPGQTSVWEVRWFVSKLPKEIKALPGNKKLVAFARSVVGVPIGPLKTN